MFRPRVIPCLLLRNDGLVKTVGFRKPRYVGDPINAVKIFNESEADELIFLDILATREGRSPNLEIVQRIGDEAYMPFAVGGGIRTIRQIADIIAGGAEKVVLNTSAMLNPGLVTEAAEVFGSQAVVVSIDVKAGWLGRARVVTHGGTRVTSADPVTHAQQMVDAGAGEIFLTAIDRDGTYRGYDYAMIRKVADAVSVPVIGAGGASSLLDLVKVTREGGASAAAAGSLFVYQGPTRGILINYPTRTALEAAFRAA